MLPRRRARAGSDDPAARRQRVELSLRAGRREAHPLRTGWRQGHRRRPRSRPSSPRAGRAGRFATCSISAAASTSAPSTAAPSRRWCAPARSTRSSRDAPRCSPSVGIALDAAERAQASAAQVSLFGEETTGPAVSLVATRDWTDAERLQHEKAAIGYYLSGHPFAALRRGARVAHAHDARQPRAAPGDACWSPASSPQMRVQASRRGKMAFVTLDDGHGSAEIMVYNETFDAARQLLREDQLVIAEVKVDAAHDRGRRDRRACASSPRMSTTSRRCAGCARNG